MAYFEIVDDQINPNRPITSKVAYQLRDNPIWIAAGHADSPVHLAPSQMEVFSVAGSGNWTVPAGVYRIRLTVIGGGGGGGGGFTDGASIWYPAGGGGAGAMVRAVARVEPGEIYAITIGAGGGGGAANTAGSNGSASTFALGAINAGGGGGGAANTRGGSAGSGSAGTPGDLLGGVIEAFGQPGGHGARATPEAENYGGNGGASVYGAGGRGGTSTAAGDTGILGAGGGGGGPGQAGGAGVAGAIVIEY